MSRNAERAVWMMVGAAIGAGVALLYAPKSGKDARKFLRKRAGHVKETLLETGESVVETSRELYENVADATRGAYGTVADAGRDVYKKSASAAAGAAQGAAGIYEKGRRTFQR